jgi:hypothetical protein
LAEAVLAGDIADGDKVEVIEKDGDLVIAEDM